MQLLWRLPEPMPYPQERKCFRPFLEPVSPEQIPSKEARGAGQQNEEAAYSDCILLNRRRQLASERCHNRREFKKKERQKSVWILLVNPKQAQRVHVERTLRRNPG